MKGITATNKAPVIAQPERRRRAARVYYNPKFVSFFVDPI